MSTDPTPLPHPLSRAIQELVTASGLTGAAARELRDDLEAHARDGLEAGHGPDDVARRLGDPVTAGPVFEGVRPPRPRRPDPDGGEGLLSAFASDLRLTVRGLRRDAGLTLAAIVVLGIGISATAVAFTVVNEVFLRPLPVTDQGTLVDVWARQPGNNSFAGFGWQDVLAYREAVESSGSLTGLAAFAGTRLAMGEGAGRRTVVGQLVSRNYLPLLGVSPVVGRLDLAEDPGFGGPRTAVLSHGLWREAFAADPGVVGRSVLLEGESFTVVGVAQEDFRGHFIGFPVDLWVPITAADLLLPGFDPNDRSRMPFEMIGRRAGGTGIASVSGALDAVARELESSYPETHWGHRVGVTPTSGVDHSLRPAVLAFVVIVSALASLVLLVACFNVGSLLLVRTLARRREFAVRRALGAGRARLVRQLLTEAFVLTALGTVAGLALSRLLSAQVDSLFRRLAPGLGLDLPFDLRVLALTAAAAVLASVVAGSAPALHILRKDPGRMLGGRSSGGAGARGRGLLVSAQIAVSVTLVIATGLFVRALAAGLERDPGFAADEVVVFPLSADRMLEFSEMEALLRELRALPGVLDASVASAPPTGVARSPLRVGVPGVEPPAEEGAWVVDGRRVGARYLTTVGTPILRGRDIEEADARGVPSMAVVNEAFVDRFWPAQDPLGRSLEIGGETVRVVGVAGNARTLVQDDSPDPFVFVSLAGVLPREPVVTLRTTSPAGVTDDVMTTVARFAPGAPVPSPVTARETLNAGLLAQRLGAALVGAIGAAALLLAGVGLYGLVQFTVSRDRKEFAVRIALGGSRTSVVGTVLRKGLLVVGVGAGSGVLLAAAASPGLSGFLVGVSPRDPLTYLAVVVLFGAVGVFACALPARRAMSIPPAAVLRGE